MSRNVLIYFQNSVRNIFFESFVPKLIERGYTVHVLTKCEKGIFHQKMEELGVVADGYNPKRPKLVRFFLHWRFLISYCRKNKIDIVYSHLQLANFIAVLAQYFIRAKVIPCRHHVDEIMVVNNKTAVLIDKGVNRLSKKIIVVSNAVKKQMVEREHVKPGKIVVIPLGYNFDLYNKPDPQEVSKIRSRMNCHLLLIIIARMTPGKRHIIALELLNNLVKKGLDLKLLVLDHGAEEANLKTFVKENNLEKRVLFTGFLNNTMDYVAAADLVLHPSVIEASNQVVREVGLLEKPVVVCKGIGDFDEYIVDRENGFLVSKDNTLPEMSAVVEEWYDKKEQLKEIGARFKKEVLTRFGIETIVDQYLQAAS